MASNPVVNTLTFTGSVAGQASIQAQGIAGGLTFLLPNTVPVPGQLMTAAAVNGNNVFLGFVSAQSASFSLSQLLASGATSGQTIIFNGTNWVPSTGLPGEGTVTSVSAGNIDSVFTTNVATPTSTPAITFTANTQSANTVYAGPVTGAAAAPTFRALVQADLGAGVVSIAAINSKQGSTGNAVQLTLSGATTAGDVVTYDANSNVVDSGTLLSSLASNASVALKANIASPTFTGVPAAPTAAPLTNSTQIATTAYADLAVGVETSRAVAAEALKAPLASPTFTGTVTLPSAVNATSGSDLILTATSTNEVRIATATGVFDFFGSGGANGMSLATGNASIVINSGGQIALAAAPNQDVELTASGTGIIVTNATLLAEHNIDLSDANAHIVPNHDVAGTTAITNPATTIAVVYGSNYTGTNAPNVVVTAVGADPTGLGGVWITHQGGANAWTGFTINVTTTPGTSASFSYIVIG